MGPVSRKQIVCSFSVWLGVSQTDQVRMVGSWNLSGRHPFFFPTYTYKTEMAWYRNECWYFVRQEKDHLPFLTLWF